MIDMLIVVGGRNIFCLVYCIYFDLFACKFIYPFNSLLITFFNTLLWMKYMKILKAFNCTTAFFSMSADGTADCERLYDETNSFFNIIMTGKKCS